MTADLPSVRSLFVGPILDADCPANKDLEPGITPDWNALYLDLSIPQVQVDRRHQRAESDARTIPCVVGSG